MVLIPFFADQTRNAHLLEAAGLGLVVGKAVLAGPAAPNALHAAAKAVLRNASFPFNPTTILPPHGRQGTEAAGPGRSEFLGSCPTSPYRDPP